MQQVKKAVGKNSNGKNGTTRNRIVIKTETVI